MGRRKKVGISPEEQVAAIEGACQATGLSYDELAELVKVTPDTMRKLRTGVQPAGEQLLTNIKNVPFLPSIQAKLRGATLPAKEGELSISSLTHHPLTQKLVFILQNATGDERKIVAGVIDGIFAQLNKRLGDEDKAFSQTRPKKSKP